MTDAQQPVWTRRFESPYLLTAMPARGPGGRAILLYNQTDSARAILADLTSGERSAELPFPVAMWAALTPDGEWVLQLVDDGGSEIGHLMAFPVDGGEAVDLTPDRTPYVMRGLDVSADGSTALLSVVDDDGFHLVAVPLRPFGDPRVVHSTPHEAWWGRASADGRYASFDTTDHGPGMRRTAVSVFDVETSTQVGVLDDLPDGPARACCFSEVSGDPRLLVSTERTGFARPGVWNPVTDVRRDFPLSELMGEVIALDWYAAGGKILAVHVREGIQTVIEIDEESGKHHVLSTQDGSYLDPDVGSTHPYISRSFYLPGGSAALARSRWDLPLHLVRMHDGVEEALVEPADVPAGRRLESQTITSSDGTRLQLWVALPDRPTPLGTVLEVHGGPNLVTVDRYSPSAQAWLDEGFAYASLNYRGSVTFGKEIREGFWHALGERELADIEAAVDYLRSRGVADPETTFITGASYGGFLTLLSVGRLPDLFAGGLAHVAMADWKASFEDQNAAQRGVWLQWIGGDPEEFEARTTHYSPLTYVSHVKASVWLNQGTHDTRTPVAQAQVYADALAAAGGDVLIDWFDDGHEPTGLTNLLADQVRMSQLVHRTLAGQAWATA